MLYLPLLVTSTSFCRPVQGVIHQFPFVGPKGFLKNPSYMASAINWLPSNRWFNQRIPKKNPISHGFYGSAINCTFIGSQGRVSMISWISSQTSFKKLQHEPTAPSGTNHWPKNLGRFTPSKLAEVSTKSDFFGTFCPEKYTFSWQKEVNYPMVYFHSTCQVSQNLNYLI